MATAADIHLEYVFQLCEELETLCNHELGTSVCMDETLLPTETSFNTNGRLRRMADLLEAVTAFITDTELDDLPVQRLFALTDRVMSIHQATKTCRMGCEDLQTIINSNPTEEGPLPRNLEEDKDLVFCIDDASTVIRDDAYSYDVCSGTFRVHVTDVERWMKSSTGPTLGFVRDAMGFGDTLYFPQGKEDLFPKDISEKLLTLDAVKDRTEVVTVEFKLVNRAGHRATRTAVNPLETRVHLSRIKRPYILTYEEADVLISDGRRISLGEVDRDCYAVNAYCNNCNNCRAFSLYNASQQMSLLRRSRLLGGANFHQRNSGRFFVNRRTRSLRLQPRTKSQQHGTWVRQHRRDPIIACTTTRGTTGANSRQLIEELCYASSSALGAVANGLRYDAIYRTPRRNQGYNVTGGFHAQLNITNYARWTSPARETASYLTIALVKKALAVSPTVGEQNMYHVLGPNNDQHAYTAAEQGMVMDLSISSLNGHASQYGRYKAARRGLERVMHLYMLYKYVAQELRTRRTRRVYAIILRGIRDGEEAGNYEGTLEIASLAGTVIPSWYVQDIDTLRNQEGAFDATIVRRVTIRHFDTATFCISFSLV